MNVRRRLFLLDEFKIDRVIARARVYVLLGVLLWLSCYLVPKGWGFYFTAFATLSLGIYAFVLHRWRTDPGLWMLAAFLTVFLGLSFLFFEYEKFQSLFEAPDGLVVKKVDPWESAKFAADSSLALLVFAGVLRFTGSVAIENWKRTRQGTI